MAAIASFKSHTKTDNANRLADPENLYNQVSRELWKKSREKQI